MKHLYFLKVKNRTQCFKHKQFGSGNSKSAYFFFLIGEIILSVKMVLTQNPFLVGNEMSWKT